MDKDVQIALKTAFAFLQDVADDLDNILAKFDRDKVLNTLSLAAKKIAEAEKKEPNATIKLPTNSGGEATFTIPELKSLALMYEGATHTKTGFYSKAISALQKAIRLNPQSPHAYYELGMAHTYAYHKSQAVAAFNKAIELDPENITYHKQLELSKSITGAQIAYESASRAGRATGTFFKILFGLFIALSFWCIGYGFYSFPSAETIPLIFGGLVLQVIALGIWKIADFFS